MRRRTQWTDRFGRCVAALGVVGAACGQSGSASVRRTAEDTQLLARMLAAEDARGGGNESVRPLLEGLASPVSEVRRIAVRGLGRLESDSLVDGIGERLADDDASVRAEAANALGQAVSRGAPDRARELLRARPSKPMRTHEV
jgi:HEAT repeat protein